MKRITLVLLVMLIAPVMAVAPTSNFYLVPTDMKVYSMVSYDALVYQDGTYTIAVNRTGGIINATLTSAHADDVVIQAAYDSITTSGFVTPLKLGKIWVQPAKYIFSKNLVFNPGVNWNVEIESIPVTTPSADRYTTTFYGANGYDIITANLDDSSSHYGYLTVSGVRFEYAANNAGNNAVNISGYSAFSVSKSQFIKCDTGVRVNDAAINAGVDDSFFNGCLVGVDFRTTGGGNNGNHFNGNDFEHTNIAIKIRGSAGTKISSSIFEDCSIAGIELIGYHRALNIDSDYFETNTLRDVLIEDDPTWSTLTHAGTIQFTGVTSSNDLVTFLELNTTYGVVDSAIFSGSNILKNSATYITKANYDNMYSGCIWAVIVNGGQWNQAKWGGVEYSFDSIGALISPAQIQLRADGQTYPQYRIGANVDTGSIAYDSAYSYGTNASVPDGGTVLHGLSFIPSWCKGYPTVAGQVVSTTAITNTTCTFAIKNSSTGAAGTTETIYWEARK